MSATMIVMFHEAVRAIPALQSCDWCEERRIINLNALNLLSCFQSDIIHAISYSGIPDPRYNHIESQHSKQFFCYRLGRHRACNKMAKSRQTHDILWRVYLDTDDFENNEGKG